jgi:hypothetical protein
MATNFLHNLPKSNQIVFGENVEILKRSFYDQSSNYEKALQIHAKKFDEDDRANFKAFLLNLLRDNSKMVEEYFLTIYETKARSFDEQVIKILLKKKFKFKIKRYFFCIKKFIKFMIKRIILKIFDTKFRN